MDDILNMIRMGIQVKKFFPYDTQQIPIRAVSSAEFDDAKNKSVGICDEKLARQILQIQLGTLKGKIDLTTIPLEMFTNYLRYLQEFDYWVVYHSMKDFRDSSFNIEDVRKMRYVHEMAIEAISMSSYPTSLIKYKINTKDGKELLTMLWELHVPLTSELWKLTPLQKEFLEITNPYQTKKIDKIEDLDTILAAMNK